MRIPSGVTDQYIYFVAVDSTDLKTRETGLSSFTVYRSRNGAAAAAMTTPTVNETDVTNMPGVYELLLDEDMTIGSGNDSEEMVFHITATGMAPVTRTIELYRPKITAGNTLGVAADGDISGNVDGAVASVTGAVGSVTGNVGGIAGTIQTLDALDTAQDTQHSTTQTHLTDIKGATFSGATDSLEAIRDRGDAAWTTGAGGTPPQLLQSTTIATLASQTSFTLTAGSADNDAYNGAIAVITDSATSTQKAVGTISDYVGSTRTVTLSADPAIFTMAVGDTIEIIAALGSAGSAPTAAAVADAVWDELQSGHVTAGSFGEIATEIATLLTNTSNIETDTQNIQSRLPAALVSGRMDSSVGAVAAGAITAAGFGSGAIDAAALSTDAVAEIADGVWDEVLSVGTHNIGNSAGRRLRSIQDFGIYDLASVWVDEVAGTSTGTTDGEDATVTNRANDFDNAQTVADSVGITSIRITNGNSITLTAALAGYEVWGNGSTLALGGQNLSGTILREFGSITGIATSSANLVYLEDCTLGAVTLPPGAFHQVSLAGTFTVGAVGDYQFRDCASAIAGGTAPTIDLGAAVGATTISLRRWSGGLTLNNMQAGDAVSVDVVSGGTITVNGTGGTVAIRGICNVVDGSSGSVSITQTSVVNMTKINSEVDTAISDAALATAAALATVDANVDAILADTNELQTDDVPGLIAALNDISVADVLGGTITELGSVPAASPTMAQALALLYMAVRNKRDTTATSDEIHNDAGTPVGTATVSDDGTTFSKSKYA